MEPEEFGWHDYLEYSEYLLNNCSQALKSNKKLEQAHFRTIISKSYYYAYHSCKLFIEANFPQSAKNITGTYETGMHKAVGQLLRGADTNIELKDLPEKLKVKIKDLGKNFNILKDYRVACDYKLKDFYNPQTGKKEPFKPTFSSTQRHLNKVKSFIREMNLLEQELNSGN